jgi:PsbP
VEAVERDKEGVMSVSVLGKDIVSVDGGDLDAYKLEYVVDSTRGLNRFLVVATIKDKRLFVLTTQFKEGDATTIRPLADSVIKSFHVD